MDQSSPELVKMVGESLLVHHDSSRGYNLSQSTEKILASFTSRPDDLALEMEDEYFQGKLQHGFFVEAGAASGEADSHSLFFELSQGWTGLLVEPGVTDLELKNRLAAVSMTCLATQPRPHYAHFNWHSTTAFLDSDNNIRAMAGLVSVTERGGRWEVYY